MLFRVNMTFVQIKPNLNYIPIDSILKLWLEVDIFTNNTANCDNINNKLELPIYNKTIILQFRYLIDMQVR